MEETRPKVLALYRAVLELLDKGMYIEEIKVADITGQAGIGKGTAYEYFKSKEELIAGALIHDVGERAAEGRKKLERLPDFTQRIGFAFDWILNNFQDQRSFIRLLRLTSQPCETSSALLEELKKRKEDACTPARLLYEMCAAGKEEGFIREELPIAAAFAMAMGSFVAFILYLEEGRKHGPALEPEEMKELLWQGLLKQLQ